MPCKDKEKRLIPMLSKKQRLKRLQELREMLAERERAEQEIKALNPFWFYEPSDGTISEQGMQLLNDYLKPEDVPQRFDSQLDVHLSNADINGAFGGNQSGKTTAGSIEGFIWTTGEVPFSLKDVYPKEKIPTVFPQHVRVETIDWNTLTKTVLPTYQYWCPKEYLINGSWEKSYSSENRILKLGKKNQLRGTLEFMTNKQDVESHQGPPRHGMIYDEEPKYSIYKENLMRFTTADRIKIFFGLTPTKGLTWLYEEIFMKAEDGRGNDINCFNIASVTNKKANLAVVRKILDGQGTYPEVKMRLLGLFVSLSGFIYGALFNQALHLISPFELVKGGRMDDYTIYRGIDPHLTTPTSCIEIAIDREGFEYVVGSYIGEGDTEEIKTDLAQRVKDRKYRLGWTSCDKSADSDIKILGDRNIFLELARGKNAIPALFTSEKYAGSIHAGVDEIKKLLKIDPKLKKPKLFIFNIPENKPLITAMRTLERDRARNEEVKGERDKINEGKYHAHACLRYCHQRPMRWLPPVEEVPEYVPDNEAVNY